MKNKIIFIVGPTAVGKTDIAVELAKILKTEIISSDSMQVYKGMEIVSSQPSKAIKKKIFHHLVGVILLNKEYNVSTYRRQALKIMESMIRKGMIPVFCGGSGLYMSVLIDGIFKIKTEDEALRDKLYRQAEKFGSVVLYNKLKAVDPLAAEKIHPNDTRRIVRALEVFKVSGKPISLLQKQRKGIADKYDIRIFCINIDREKLRQRIVYRIDKMFAKGLAREAKKLLKLNLSKTSRQAIGLKELKGYFEGDYDLTQARRLMELNTQRYAKRQLTWFRKDKRIEWINLRGNETAAKVANKIWKKLSL